MPTSINVTGMCSATMIAAKAIGKQTNSSTTTRISQTWFASQIGAIASRSARTCGSARGPRANNSQTPLPKSAPPEAT
jgi:hypothetical protein